MPGTVLVHEMLSHLIPPINPMKQGLFITDLYLLNLLMRN